MNNYKYVQLSSVKIWRKIFKLATVGIDHSKPLSPEVLSNPNHPFVKIILNIYSMQAFVYIEMNKTSRFKDRSKIKYYGAFASTLGFIIHCSNKKNTDFGKQFKLYRGS